MTGEDVKAFFDAKVSRIVTMYNLNPGIKGAMLEDLANHG